MLKLFITIVLFLCVIAYADAARPRRKESPCDKYEKEIKNSKGVTKCIPKEGSCNGKLFSGQKDYFLLFQEVPTLSISTASNLHVRHSRIRVQKPPSVIRRRVIPVKRLSMTMNTIS